MVYYGERSKKTFTDSLKLLLKSSGRRNGKMSNADAGWFLFSLKFLFILHNL